MITKNLPGESTLEGSISKNEVVLKEGRAVRYRIATAAKSVVCGGCPKTQSRALLLQGRHPTLRW